MTDEVVFAGPARRLIPVWFILLATVAVTGALGAGAAALVLPTMRGPVLVGACIALAIALSPLVWAPVTFRISRRGVTARLEVHGLGLELDAALEPDSQHWVQVETEANNYGGTSTTYRAVVCVATKQFETVLFYQNRLRPAGWDRHDGSLPTARLRLACPQLAELAAALDAVWSSRPAVGNGSL